MGCASHKLNLAVKNHLRSMEPILKKLDWLMSKLSTLKQSAKLRRRTSLLPVKRNVTRWSSTFSMVERYNQIADHLDSRDSEISNFIPTYAEERALRATLEDLKVFESVSLELQKSTLDLLAARKLFLALIARYKNMENYLSPQASIVHTPAFDSGICKLLQDSDDLDDDEKEAVSCFENDEYVAIEDTRTFAEKVLKKSRLISSKYKSVGHVPATSNHAERFFSSAKLVISDLRKSMLPRNLEMLLFLKVNRDLWDENLLLIVFNEKGAKKNESVIDP